MIEYTNIPQASASSDEERRKRITMNTWMKWRISEEFSRWRRGSLIERVQHVCNGYRPYMTAEQWARATYARTWVELKEAIGEAE